MAHGDERIVIPTRWQSGSCECAWLSTLASCSRAARSQGVQWLGEALGVGASGVILGEGELSVEGRARAAGCIYGILEGTLYYRFTQT